MTRLRPAGRHLLWCVAVGTALTAPAEAQTSPTVVASPAKPAAVLSPRPWGRIMFSTSAIRLVPTEGESVHREEYTTAVTFHTADAPTTVFEVGVDARATRYSQATRTSRLSLYEAWTGARIGDRLRVRGGHLWLTELGGLGAVAGGLVELRHAFGASTVRVGAFGGLEPRNFEAGYVENVTRTGGYVSYDDGGTRRHTLGYALIRNQGLTERSVISTTNYLPLSARVYLYQAAEYDLQGPAGNGTGGLTYAFMNTRVVATSRLDLLASYHRGRSVDARTLTLDQINGRPVPAKSLEGLLYESMSGRATFAVAKGVRFFIGYGRDRTNRDSNPTSRLQLGGHASNLVGSGVDLTASWHRLDRGSPGSNDAYYVSVGRSATPSVYLSIDYGSSLAVLRLTRGDGVVIETHPNMQRIGATASVMMGRQFSFLLTTEYSHEQTADDLRVFSSLSYRLR